VDAYTLSLMTQFAIAAIHDFLRFQISEHRTGDSLEVENAH
jgi:hypothetical protein